MTDPRKRTVQAGYDAISERYLAWGCEIEGDPRRRFLEELARPLPEKDRVLDLGCGAGVPSTQALAGRFEVTGVDVSGEQLRVARENVPQATFIQADFAEIEFPAETFDGVAAFYSISHVPRDEHADLFRRIARWLRPGGLFLASLGSGGSEDWTGEWLGVPMFFSSHDAKTNRTLLQQAGFALLVDEVVEMKEPEGPVAFLWVLAQKVERAGS
jgi:ubiquinone/menaquinone biosynthesis C-methylase UbiE